MKHIKKIEKCYQAKAVQTVNAMLDYINKAGPEILALLEGQTSGKSTNRPPIKIHSQIEAITAAAPCRSYVQYSSGGSGPFVYCSVWLKTDCNFREGKEGYRYTEQDVYLCNLKDGILKREGPALKVWPLYKEADIERLQNEFEAAQEALREAESNAHKAADSLRHFCR
jgi:hypothetical protein